MRAWGALQSVALLTATLWATTLEAKKDAPSFAVKEFAHFPRNLNYFDETEVILFQDISDNNVWRSPDGGVTWGLVAGVPEGAAFALFMHDYDPNRAYILTAGIQHYRSSDQGKTWDMFQVDAEMSMFRGDILQFNAGDPDRILFNGMDCQGLYCEEVAMYTTDGFKTAAKFLRGNTAGCWWAHSSTLFTTSAADLDRDRILCIVRDAFSPFKQDQRLLISDNFFSAVDASGQIQEFEPNLDTDRPVSGIINIAVVKKYLLVATTSMNTDEMALFVTDDTLRWHRAMFPTDHGHRVTEEAYTVLEGTNYSIQIDVMTTRPSNPMGVLFTSNSNGTYFTENIEHTNRNSMGHVDFEKISGIQGIFLVNKVGNWEDVESSARTKKQILTEITFDDGRTFDDVKVDGKRLHLHSVTDPNNVGAVFSSPAPGLVMGNGNTGDSLGDYWQDSNLYVSDNAGVTWIKALDGPYKYEFGDQGSVLVAVRDTEKFDVGEIQYSLDHGQTWTAEPLPDKLTMRPVILTTVQDSTSLKFTIIGEKTADGPSVMVSVDFEGLHEATCKDSDLEDWFARVDDKGEPTCLMGHTQKYRRRKKNAECFLKKEFNEPVVVSTDCECKDQDFECDFNFARNLDDPTECIAKGPLAKPDGACKGDKADDTFQGSSGWRLIPGNTCKRTSGAQKDDPVERKCADTINPPAAPASGKLSKTPNSFDGKWTGAEFHYLEPGESSAFKTESIIMRPRGSKLGPISITHDHGKTWVQPEELTDPIAGIVPHRHFKDMVFFVTYTEKVIYTVDGGANFHTFHAPYKPAIAAQHSPFAFHPDKKDWLLWMGDKCDEDGCYPAVSWSKDRGDHWTTGARYAERCEFTGGSAVAKFGHRAEQQIVCLETAREDPQSKENPLQLISTDDWFVNTEVRETNVKDFATMAEFIVVATEDTEKGSLQAHASLDGQTFAEAHFPHNFQVPHQRAYTVLDSSTHAVNLFVATETKDDRRHGSIFKSNSNGTSYVLSVDRVNCDSDYYVDFEKMLGLEGIALVNIVSNSDEDAPKKLRSKITHNDGATWAFLPPPKVDSDNKAFGCGSFNKDGSCALHIHGYTERDNRGNTYSSQGAVGLMFAWGNVGSELGSAKDADTFMTTDAGITWNQVKKGRWTWAFGDQGSIIVLVQTAASGVETDTLYYSTNEGADWTDYKFSDEKVTVTDISTLRSGGSRNFLLWTMRGEKLSAVNVDFSGLTDRVCKHDDKNLGNSDYYVWSPEHPETRNGCLFGHISQYLRKKSDKVCYNDFTMQHLYSQQNCTCDRPDFECDYNYEPDGTGYCRLVTGLQPLDPAIWCEENPNEIQYYEPTGYRRLPLTTCVGGNEFDKQSAPQPCEKHKDEFDRAHPGLSGVSLFLAIVIPFAAAGAIGWYVWRHWSTSFGQIRLGEGGDGRGAFDDDRPWVKYPIIALSAVVAAIGALPVVAGALWRTGKSATERWGWSDGGGGGWSRLGGGGTRRFTTRDSFARGRGDYDIVDDDEGELLGEDSDEEV